MWGLGVLGNGGGGGFEIGVGSRKGGRLEGGVGRGADEDIPRFPNEPPSPPPPSLSL